MRSPIKSILISALILVFSHTSLPAADSPYGIVPRQDSVRFGSREARDAWHLRFNSLSEFIGALQQTQPTFETLGSGETDLAYYVIFRAKPDIFIFSYSLKNGENLMPMLHLTGSNNNQNMLDAKTGLLPVELMHIILFADDHPGPSVSVMGYATRIDSTYKGPLLLNFELDSQGNRSTFSISVNWKSVP